MTDKHSYETTRDDGTRVMIHDDPSKDSFEIFELDDPKMKFAMAMTDGLNPEDRADVVKESMAELRRSFAQEAWDKMSEADKKAFADVVAKLIGKTSFRVEIERLVVEGVKRRVNTMIDEMSADWHLRILGEVRAAFDAAVPGTVKRVVDTIVQRALVSISEKLRS